MQLLQKLLDIKFDRKKNQKLIHFFFMVAEMLQKSKFI